MKLLRFKITDKFRALQAGFEVHFLREWDYGKAAEFNPYVLAGPNGSGKSNILEALAAIFYHVECIYLNSRPPIFDYDEEDNPAGFRADKSIPNAFELEYLFPLSLEKRPIISSFIKINEVPIARIKICKEPAQEPEVHWLNRADFEEGAVTRLSRVEIKEFLPKFILGYASGQNETLSLPFFKMRFVHFDEYKDRLIRNLDYGQVPEGRLIYLDSAFNQAVVLSNLLLQPDVTLAPFKKEMGIEGIEGFRLIIRKYIAIDEKKQQVYSESLLEEREDEVGTKRKVLDITQKVKPTLEKLEKCSTTSYYDHDYGTLYLDYWVNDATKEAFKLHFGSALDLFQVLQILLTLNLYSVSEDLKKELYQSDSLYVNETVPTLPSDERIMRFKDFIIKKRGVNDIVYGKSLSDGEHQFLQTLGLCLLFKDENCLFLLDEPETHFNPEWRAIFNSRLRDCFEEGKAKSTMREMLVTTHTPFLISDSPKEYVLLFEKDENTQHIEVRQPNFNTLGASINKITIEAFKKFETIGDFAGSKLRALEKRFNEGKNSDDFITEASNLLGDSVEKVLFLNKVIESRRDK